MSTGDYFLVLLILADTLLLLNLPTKLLLNLPTKLDFKMSGTSFQDHGKSWVNI